MGAWFTGTKKDLHQETNVFLEKYKELSNKYLIIPVDCNVSRGGEIQETLLLTRLINQDGLKYFFQTENFQDVLSSTSAPFYVLTKSEEGRFIQDLVSSGLVVTPLENGVYFGCSFYLIGEHEGPF